MDEPTTGLHLSDTGRLLTIMNRLVDGGNTVVVIEHHLDIVHNADWTSTWDPKAATRVAPSSLKASPHDLLNAKQSLTSRYL